MRTPLHLAALQGDAAAVTGLCTYQAKVNLKDEHALTPLHKAAAQGHNEAAEELLAHNANPDVTDEVTPVSCAMVQCCVAACVYITCARQVGDMNAHCICSFRQVTRHPKSFRRQASCVHDARATNLCV